MARAERGDGVRDTVARVHVAACCEHERPDAKRPEPELLPARLDREPVPSRTGGGGHEPKPATRAALGRRQGRLAASERHLLAGRPGSDDDETPARSQPARQLRRDVERLWLLDGAGLGRASGKVDLDRFRAPRRQDGERAREYPDGDARRRSLRSSLRPGSLAMGQEADCTARFGDAVSAGRALLETDELVFRGDFRLVIPIGDVRSAEANDGRLTVTFSKGWAVFELGDQAERWAARIRNPRTLVDKLGVKPGARVSVLGLDDPAFLELLAGRTVLVTVDNPQESSDLVLFRADSVADLDRIGVLRRFLAPAGALWIVAPKGGDEPTESQVLAAGRAAGLVDTKVARFSDTHTAHRFSIPKAER